MLRRTRVRIPGEAELGKLPKSGKPRRDIVLYVQYVYGSDAT
jgi:hypothetical protein